MRVHNIGGGGGAGEICMQLLHLISIINVYQTLHRVQCMMHYRYTQWYTDYYIRGALLCLAIIGWGCKSTPAPPVPTPLSRAIINTDIHYQACACMLVFDCSNIFKYDIDVVGDHSTYKLGNFKMKIIVQGWGSTMTEHAQKFGRYSFLFFFFLLFPLLECFGCFLVLVRYSTVNRYEFSAGCRRWRDRGWSGRRRGWLFIGLSVIYYASFNIIIMFSLLSLLFSLVPLNMFFFSATARFYCCYLFKILRIENFIFSLKYLKRSKGLENLLWLAYLSLVLRALPFARGERVRGHCY